MAFLGDGSRLTASLETAWDELRGLQEPGPLARAHSWAPCSAVANVTRWIASTVAWWIRCSAIWSPSPTSAGKCWRRRPRRRWPASTSVRDAETDRTIALVYFADGGAAVSDGSAGRSTSLADAVGSKSITGNAATDALIVVSGEAGPITGNISLAGNQILLGGGSTLQVLGNVTNEMATFTPTAFDAAASRPTITHDGTLGSAVLSATGVDHM